MTDTIQKLATELNTELAGNKPLTSEQRASLENLQRDLQKMLAEGGETAHPKTVLESLRRSAGRFEVSHPNLTLIMTEAINELSTMGF